jgi:hypothetical protein
MTFSTFQTFLIFHPQKMLKMSEFCLDKEFSSLVKVTHGGTDLYTRTHCNVSTEPLYAKIIRHDTKLRRNIWS